MKMKIIFLCAVLLAAPTITYGQKTEISVQKGKVLAQTAIGEATVDAGKKAILTQNENPSVTIDDIMVDDVVKIHGWLEDEKDANRIPIDSISIQVISIESETDFKGVGLNEMPNTGQEPSNICEFKGTLILEDPKYYDLEGNLLDFEMEQINASHCNYYLHFPETVEPGSKFKCITTVGLSSGLPMWKDGVLWHYVMENNPSNCVNYFIVILPQSAILVDSSRPVVVTENINGRTAITTRNYTGNTIRGRLHIAFLWPEKDDTSLADLPPQYRGLRDERELDLVAYYHEEMQKILNGQTFKDQSTPLNTLLTMNSAIVKRNADFLIASSFEMQETPKFLEQINSMWDTFETALFKNLDLLNTDLWPELHNNGDVHVVSLCRKNSLLCELNLIFAYEDGKWYQIGNVYGPKPKDLTTFKHRYSERASSSSLDPVPWNEAGSEAIELYNTFIADSNIPPRNWCVLGIKLVGGEYWEKALDCFQRCEKLHTKPEGIYYFAALVWQGHIHDISGQREQAIEKYNNALKTEGFSKMQHDQWGIDINFKWVKDRLETPFTKEMIGK